MDKPHSRLLIGDAERLRLKSRYEEERELARRLNAEGHYAEAMEASKAAEQLLHQLEDLQKP